MGRGGSDTADEWRSALLARSDGSDNGSYSSGVEKRKIVLRWQIVQSLEETTMRVDRKKKKIE